jgi:hypothetical protein
MMRNMPTFSLLEIPMGAGGEDEDDEVMEVVLEESFFGSASGGPLPAPHHVLERLPRISVEQSNINQYKGEACPICLCNYNLCEQVCRLSCNHIYHHHCITSWLELHNSCPNCRRPCS